MKLPTNRQEWNGSTRVLVAGLACILCGLSACRQPEQPGKPELMKQDRYIHTDGTRIVDGEGQPLVLKGCNLGNWLLLEMWMMDIHDIHDQHEFESILTERFGEDGRQELMELFRTNWIRERDFELIRRFGFNVVRLPFDYRLLEDDQQPFTLRPDAFKWLDLSVEWAQNHGLFVILDMHSVPGGQSVDHTTGHAGQNRLYSDPQCRERTVWLWRQIAEHYRDNETVAAYDLINEPFGDYKTEDHQQALSEIIDEIYRGIRTVDARHMIMIPGTFAGFKFYGNPADRGWSNVVFEEHYYPGLHGNGPPTLETHKDFINTQLVWLDRYLEQIQTPFLLGEFNVVFRKAGGPRLTRWYYDWMAARNWAATMWSYKLVQQDGGLGEDNWYMVKNAADMPKVSVRTSSLEDIRQLFRWFGEMEYVIDTPLMDAMTTPVPERIALLEPAPPAAPPFSDPLEDWQAIDIGDAIPGGQQVTAPDSFTVYGGGDDIWNDHDAFRFVCRAASADFALQAAVNSLTDPNPYAKAGLMVRAGTEPDAAHVLIHVFPDSQVVTGWREKPGARMQERKFKIGAFPVRLRLSRAGGTVRAAYAFRDGEWQDAGTFDIPALQQGGRVGTVVLSHDNRFLAAAEFTDIKQEGWEK